VLNGDNQYYCERCACKHDATRRIRLKSLPPVLNFQLARFVFEKYTLLIYVQLSFNDIICVLSILPIDWCLFATYTDEEHVIFWIVIEVYNFC